MFNGLVLSLCHNDQTIFGSDCASLLTDPLNLVIKGSLLVKVADLVCVGLVFEIIALLRCEGLPLLTNFLHDLQCTHFLVFFHNQRSRL